MNAEPNKKPPARRLLGPGDAAPWFHARALDGASNYAFDTVAGRHVLMLFFGSAGRPEAAEALAALLRHRSLFDDARACFFGVSVDPEDEARKRIAQLLPGIRFFLDHDGEVSRLYGALAEGAYRPHWLLLDPALRVLGAWPINRPDQAIARLAECVAAPSEGQWAPVLRIPNVIEPELCAELVRRY